MVCCKPFCGRFDNGFHGIALCFKRLAEPLFEMGGNPSDTGDGNPGRIAAQVPPCEFAEGPDDHPVHFGTRHVCPDERREGGEEPVGEGFAVDAADDLLVGESGFGEELLPEWDVPLEDAVEQCAAQGCTASFVAEDVAQRGDLPDDLAAAAEAGVRAGPEDAGDPFAATPQGPGRAREVRFDGDLLCPEVAGEELPESFRGLGKGPAAPGAVEPHGRDASEPGQFGQRTADLLVGVLDGIDSAGAHFAHPGAVVGDPRALGRSAVCKEYHYSKIHIIYGIRKWKCYN